MQHSSHVSWESNLIQLPKVAADVPVICLVCRLQAPHGTLPDVWEQVQAIVKQEPRPMFPHSVHHETRLHKQGPHPVARTRPATGKNTSHAKKSSSKRGPRSAALTRSPMLEFGAHLFEAPATG
jgi:hypothetical protein